MDATASQLRNLCCFLDKNKTYAENMKRVICAVLAVLLCVGLLAACGGSEVAMLMQDGDEYLSNEYYYQYHAEDSLICCMRLE